MKPKSILKASQHHRASFGTPPRAQPIISGNWADRLQHTLSPKKQDRHTLRDTQGSMFKERPQNIFTDLRFGNNRSSFATSIDVMNSLFGKDCGKREEAGNGRKEFSGVIPHCLLGVHGYQIRRVAQGLFVGFTVSFVSFIEIIEFRWSVFGDRLHSPPRLV